MVLVIAPPAREVVGVFKTRNAFEPTIAALADADSGQMTIAVADMIGAAVGGRAFKSLSTRSLPNRTRRLSHAQLRSEVALFSGCPLTMKPTRKRRLTFSLLRPRITFTLSQRKAKTWCVNRNQFLNTTLG